MQPGRPIGAVTRGTTNPNRLRRCDRWLAGPQAWRLRQSVTPPVVVDLGYGASPITAVELADRLAAVRADIEVVGIEIEPSRVAAGRVLERPGLRFVRGGFEIPVAGEVRIVRAFNVLRQYAEDEVGGAWDLVQSRLSADGLFVDGTCDELGRLATWVALDRSGPISLTLSMRLAALDDPATIAERLPKALIHRNIRGEPIHDYLRALSQAWAWSSPHASYGARQRFRVTAQSLKAEGWPLLDGPSRWRLGELTVAWAAVAPGG